MRRDSTALSRRGILRLAGGAGIASLGRLYASGDFWNKKDPSEWTGAEIDQLTNKSPWAKELTITGPAQGSNRGGYGGGGGYPGGGGGGYPGGGGVGFPGGGIGFPGGGMGRRRGGGGGMPGQSYKAVIRWESAQPILDALKKPLPKGLENHYVISVGGIPVDAGSRRRYQSGGEDDSSQSNQDVLDRMKGVTYLQPKDKRDLQPGIIVQQPANYGDIYFGFAKDLVTLRPEDKEVAFTTSFGTMTVKAKFNLKEMMYHGALAV